jgi:hypothetical protein
MMMQILSKSSLQFITLEYFAKWIILCSKTSNLSTTTNVIKDEVQNYFKPVGDFLQRCNLKFTFDEIFASWLKKFRQSRQKHFGEPFDPNVNADQYLIWIITEGQNSIKLDLPEILEENHWSTKIFNHILDSPLHSGHLFTKFSLKKTLFTKQMQKIYKIFYKKKLLNFFFFKFQVTKFLFFFFL